jgi:hypothetical protein
MSVHEQVVYRNIYTFAIKKRLNEPFSEICPAPKSNGYECREIRPETKHLVVGPWPLELKSMLEHVNH